MTNVWVNGGASGIGRATAVLLAREGARVTGSDRDEAGLDMLAVEADVEVEVLDVSQSADVERVAERVLGRYDRLDALVNTAGINIPDRRLDAMTIQSWDRV